MPLNWKPDLESLSIDAILLLEECQLEWIDQEQHREAFAMVFRAHPHIAWYIRNKAPSMAAWVDAVAAEYRDTLLPPPETLRALEGVLLRSMEDWIVYATDPQVYQDQPFVGWDERELLDMAGWAGKRVLDIGSGTGKQAFTVAPRCRELYCAEPVHTLRKYLKARARREGITNVRVADGLITDLPYEAEFFDVVMGGHVFGDRLEAELAECLRVLRPGGLLLFIPGSGHDFLVAHGFAWSEFEEPGDGTKRKYWRTK